MLSKRLLCFMFLVRKSEHASTLAREVSFCTRNREWKDEQLSKTLRTRGGACGPQWNIYFCILTIKTLGPLQKRKKECRVFEEEGKCCEMCSYTYSFCACGFTEAVVIWPKLSENQTIQVVASVG